MWKHEIEFTNQTYPSFVNSYNRKFYDDNENKRINFTPEERQKLLKFYENKCNNCEEECSKEFEIDHISLFLLVEAQKQLIIYKFYIVVVIK